MNPNHGMVVPGVRRKCDEIDTQTDVSIEVKFG